MPYLPALESRLQLRYEQADPLRATLVQLSSRQMKSGVQFPEPALLAGLWVAFQSLAVFELIGPELLRELVQGVLLDPEGDYPPPVGKESV